MSICTPDTLKRPYLELVGVDSHPLSIVSAVDSALRQAGNTRELREQFRQEALSGDYDHVIATAVAYTTSDRSQAQPRQPETRTDLARLESAFAALRDAGVDARASFMCCSSCAATAIAGESGDDADFVFWHQQDDEDAFGREEARETCCMCSGSGTERCGECDGSGTAPCYNDDDRDAGEEPCDSCDGSGSRLCDGCAGDGEYVLDGDGDRASDDLASGIYLAYGGKDDQRTVKVGRLVCGALQAEGLKTEWDGDPSERIWVLPARVSCA